MSNSKDESDNVILATAIAGNAPCLVTGGRADLLSLKRVQNVSIISAQQAAKMLDDQFGKH